MPAFSLSRSITINASPEAVYAVVRDFRRWPEWSPWLIAEPDCSVDVAADGNSYTWDGTIVGSGAMRIEREETNQRIEYELTFLKPWKSVSSVSFSFEANGSGTQATWTMDGSLPFFLFWMKKMMTAMIRMDYDRGLNMLKDLVESGGVPSKLDFPSAENQPEIQYIGVRTNCTLADIGPSMGADFTTLKDALSDAGVKPSGHPFSIYHKFDMVKGFTEYTAAVPVAEVPSSLPANVTAGALESHSTYRVAHTGPYRHIGNAWAAGMMRERAKVFKKNKRLHPYEVYENEPGSAPENELETTIHFPIA